MAPDIRDFVATLDPKHYDIKTSPWSKTGYISVIMVKGKYQARLQVKGDGRGGERKRGQHALPGLFDTALEAATCISPLSRRRKRCGKMAFLRSRSTTATKARSKAPAKPAQPGTPVSQSLGVQQMLLPTTMVVGINVPLLNAPLVAATSIPPPSFGYFPSCSFAM